MDPPAKRRPDRRAIKAVRPGLLAGGLGLMWYVQMQKGGVPDGVPAWGVALILAGRLFADFVGAWVAISVLRLGLAVIRLGVTQLRVQMRSAAR